LSKPVSLVTRTALASALLAAAASASLSTTAAAASSSGSIPPGTVLNVGDQAQEFSTLFKLAGLDNAPYKINFVEFDSGPLVDAGFAAGRIDIGLLGDLPAATAIQSGLPVRAVNIEASVSSAPGEWLIAKPGIDSIGQLRGKTVAVTAGTAGQGFVLRALAQGGLRPTDVDEVNVPAQDNFTVLETGKVDAADIGGPELEQEYLHSHPGAKVLATNLSVSPPTYAYMLASTSALANQAKYAALLDYTKREVEAANWADTHKQQYATGYLVDVEHETPAEALVGINEYVGGAAYVPFSSAVQYSLQDIINLEAEAGALKGFSVARLFADKSWLSAYANLLNNVEQTNLLKKKTQSG
jgi:sulfonate transport system substrate-binding protein